MFCVHHIMAAPVHKTINVLGFPFLQILANIAICSLFEVSCHFDIVALILHFSDDCCCSVT